MLLETMKSAAGPCGELREGLIRAHALYPIDSGSIAEAIVRLTEDMVPFPWKQCQYQEMSRSKCNPMQPRKYQYINNLDVSSSEI
jgi:hypothetical protein